MEARTRWDGKMSFTTRIGGIDAPMDAQPPLGDGKSMTPKQLVVAGLSGCTAMDVVALLKKHKQGIEGFEIEAQVEKSSGGHPEVFTQATLIYRLTGPIEPSRAIEAVTLSQTRYCGVSAMLSQAFPIRYRIELNGQQIGEGSAFPSGSSA